MLAFEVDEPETWRKREKKMEEKEVGKEGGKRRKGEEEREDRGWREEG